MCEPRPSEGLGEYYFFKEVYMEEKSLFFLCGGSMKMLFVVRYVMEVQVL